uniref:Uncharacterized protein n=1 Tax=Caenorhabditis tropicalis TaxID=1561998 RepID=A0A1I7V183_9PELO
MPTRISDSSIQNNQHDSDALGTLEDGGGGFEKIEMKERNSVETTEKPEKIEKKVVQGFLSARIVLSMCKNLYPLPGFEPDPFDPCSSLLPTRPSLAPGGGAFPSGSRWPSG